MKLSIPYLKVNEIKKTKLHLKMEKATLMVNDVNKFSDAENAIEEKLQKL